MRKAFIITSIAVVVLLGLLATVQPRVLWAFALVGPMILLGIEDCFQKSQAIRRNFPLLGRFRYLFEAIRPEINQYFVESNSDGVPFSREHRSVVYQRAKNALDTLPFGTQKDVYEVGYEWIKHSLAPRHVGARADARDGRRPSVQASLQRQRAQRLGDELRRAQQERPCSR